MRAVISVSLPENMSSDLNRVVKKSGRAKSDIIKEALRLYFWEERFKKVRQGLKTAAKKKGIVTDEDVFKIIS